MMFRDTKELQLQDLREFMRSLGMGLVYTDRSVFFRRLDNHDIRISFNKAVRLFNQEQEPTWGSYSRILRRVKLQQSGPDIICTGHKVKFIEKGRAVKLICACPVFK